MAEQVDHEVKLRLRASEWLALRHAAREDDRSLSAYCRRVLVKHLERVSAQAVESDRPLTGQEWD